MTTVEAVGAAGVVLVVDSDGSGSKFDPVPLRVPAIALLTTADSTVSPKGSRIRDFKMINLNDHSVRNITQMGPNFTSTESMQKIACARQKKNEIEPN